MYESIISGIVSGTVAGLVVSAVLGLFHWRRTCRSRKKQISDVRAILIYYREKIGTEKGFTRPNGTRVKPQPIQRGHFDEMWRRLENVLDNGSPNIHFKKKQEIRDIFDFLVREHEGFGKNDALITEEYLRMFSHLEALKWLDMPAYPGGVNYRDFRLTDEIIMRNK